MPRSSRACGAAPGSSISAAAVIWSKRTCLPRSISGQLAAAVLDVFETEPLVPGHPFWTHPRIVITPHVAATSGHETGIVVLLENIRRLERGEPLQGEIDRVRGY